MITPLKSISLLSKKVSQQIAGSSNKKDVELIYTTSQIILGEVLLLLDRKQLDINRFVPSLSGHSVNQNIQRIVDLFNL